MIYVVYNNGFDCVEECFSDDDELKFYISNHPEYTLIAVHRDDELDDDPYPME